MVLLYLQLIDQRFQPLLDKDLKEFMAFAMEGGFKLKRMMGELLDYSRAGSPLDSIAPVDCNVALDYAKGKLAAAIADSGAVITRGELPTLAGNLALLSLVCEHLLSNAIKFRRGPAPKISVTAVQSEGDWLFTFEDDGIGVAPGEYVRIFSLFQQLHASGPTSGTGMGLALCRRIVEGHGGKIWVKSTLGKGSLFQFTLPA